MIYACAPNISFKQEFSEMRKATYEVLIVEELNDETDPQERVDNIAYKISSILNDPISVEVTVINPDADVKMIAARV
jgi:hypothetical protein